MKVAGASENGGDGTIVLFRPITAMQLGDALSKRPFKVVQDLMEIGHFVSLHQEIEDDCLTAYARTANFEFRIVD